MIFMRRVAVLAGLGSVVVLAACGGGTPHGNLSTASSPPPLSSSVVPTPKPTPTVAPARLYPADVPLTGHNLKPGEKPPVYPAAAKVKTQAGANAFAEFFVRTFDWAYATTNASYAKHYTGATCGLCTGLETGITKTAAAKLWYLGGRFTFHMAAATKIAPVTAPADFCSIVPVDESAEEVVDKTGKVFNGDGAHANDRLKVCMKFGDTWKTTYMAFQK